MLKVQDVQGTPVFSVIIPAHNERKFLETLLPYLQELSSGLEGKEVIVAFSPGTNDGSGELDTGPDVRFLRCQNMGRSAQMNEGARQARGEVLIFLHADVKPPERFFTDIGSVIKRGYGAGFFSYRFDSDRLLLKINSRFTSWDGCFTGGGDQCLFISKSVFDSLGGFSVDHVLMEDFEFFRRMQRKKVPYTIIKNDLLVSARKYDQNSYLRVNLANFILLLLFRLGISPRTLRVLHDSLIRQPDCKAGCREA